MERISFNQLPQGLYNSIFAVETYLNNTDLDMRLVELLRFRISQLNHCAYCLDMHSKEALAHGEDALRLYSLEAWREAPYYSEKERVALEFAEKLTLLNSSEVSDELFQKMEAHFSRDEIANLTVVVTQINTWNRLTDVFRFTPGQYRVLAQEVSAG